MIYENASVCFENDDPECCLRSQGSYEASEK